MLNWLHNIHSNDIDMAKCRVNCITCRVEMLFHISGLHISRFCQLYDIRLTISKYVLAMHTLLTTALLGHKRLRICSVRSTTLLQPLYCSKQNDIHYEATCCFALYCILGRKAMQDPQHSSQHLLPTGRIQQGSSWDQSRCQWIHNSLDRVPVQL